MEREYITKAVAEKKTALSEFESRMLIEDFGIQVVEQEMATDAEAAVAAAKRLGFPVVMKACSSEITHKTDKGLVVIGVATPEGVRDEFAGLVARAGGTVDGILVQRMARGSREVVAGLVRDVTFGPCVMFGLGGIYTEVLKDVSFRIAPLEMRDALEMMDEIKSSAILGSFRGMPEVDRNALAKILVALGNIGLEMAEVSEIDINPIIIENGVPVAVDALVTLNSTEN